MKIWVISQLFTPEIAAPSFRWHGIAKHWQNMGHDVTVLTALPNHPKGEIFDAYKGKETPYVEEVDGLRVKRHGIMAARNKGKIKRLFSMLSFSYTCWKHNKKALPAAEKPDVIVATSPTIFPVISAWLIAKAQGVPFVFEVRDLWPGIFVEMGILKKGFIYSLLEKMELFLYRRAAAIVTVTQSFVGDITSRGIPADKLRVITNGVADDEYKNADQESANGQGGVDKARNALQLNPLTKVVLYWGNFGQSQAIGQIVDAARLLMHRNDILFLLVGQGAEYERVEKMAKGMPNIMLLGPKPKAEIYHYYGMAQLALTTLRDVPGLGAFIPSKIFEVMASGKPNITAIPAGEAGDIIEASGGGVVIPAEQPEQLARTVELLIDDEKRCKKMGESGRKYAKKHYLHSSLAKKYIALLQDVTNQ